MPDRRTPQPPRHVTPHGPRGPGRAGAPTAPPPVTPLAIAAGWRPEAVRARGGDGEVARVAELQRGIIARGQLIAAGLTPAAIKHRLGIGQLHVIHPGVYLFGRPRLEPWAPETAAVLHARGRGILSHRTAAAMWGIAEAAAVHVVDLSVAVDPGVTGGRIGSRAGLAVRRTRSLARADVVLHRGLPVTSPARTLLDLSAAVAAEELEAMYALALRFRIVRAAAITELMRRVPHRAGAATLRALVAEQNRPTLTRSRYERKLLRLIRLAELPAPLVNADVEGHEVDYLWPEQRLVVELDGFAYHSNRAAFERDRLRDQRLVAAGYRVVRITARQIDRTPEAVIARIAAALVSR